MSSLAVASRSLRSAAAGCPISMGALMRLWPCLCHHNASAAAARAAAARSAATAATARRKSCMAVRQSERHEEHKCSSNSNLNSTSVSSISLSRRNYSSSNSNKRPASGAFGTSQEVPFGFVSASLSRRNYSSSNSEGSHYATLGVKPSASQAEIRQAYVALALKLHPDRNKGDPQAAASFHEVRVAYDVLSRPFTRSQYDRAVEGARVTADFADAGAAAWGEETEEQRMLRRQRYARYASGQRADVPFDDTPRVLSVIICAFCAIAYFSVAYPKAREAEEGLGPHDPVSHRDLRGDVLVKAFYNPLSGQWERLPQGFEAPLPSHLHKLYRLRYPSLRLDKSSMPTQLAVLKMPISQTELSRLVRDPHTGEHIWVEDLPSIRSSSSNNNSSSVSPVASPPAAETAAELEMQQQQTPAKPQGVAERCP